MKNWLKLLLADLAAIMCGALLTTAFAPYSVFPFAIIALAGLIGLLINATPKRSFWLGFLFGVGAFGTGVYWVYISIHFMGEVPILLAGAATAGMVMLLAMYPAVTCYLMNKYFGNNINTKIVYAFPALWVFSEWARSWLFDGFPWLFVGYSQINSPLRGFAPYLSVYGVSLAAVLTSALIVSSALYFKQKQYRQAYLSLFMISLLWIGGAMLNLVHWTKPNGKPVAVSLVQGNIPQEVKWVPEHIRLSFDRYTELTKPLWQADHIIIWPESAIPMSLQDSAAFIQDMDDKAIASNSHLILGIPIQTQGGYFNAIVTLGKEKHSYLKRRLVPFGEYVPMQHVLMRAFKYLNIPISNLIPGKMDQKPIVINNVKILTSVCFEIAFPELTNTHDEDVGILLTVTNDAWFGNSSAQAQHLEMARMRALELMRPVLFVSNDGITAIIGPDGDVKSALPAHEAGVLNGTVQPMQGLTPWMSHGIDAVLMVLIISLITAWRSNRRAIKALTLQQNT